MSRHDDEISVRQMLDRSREAVSMARGNTRAALTTDRMLEPDLTRLVEVVGEAASRVSAPTKSRHPDVPWPAIVGMRNRLIHGYDAVDLDVLWDTVEVDLPRLIAQLDPSLKRPSSGSTEPLGTAP